MNLISMFDFISTMAIFMAIVMLLSNFAIQRDIKLLMCGLLLFYTVHYLCLFSQWSGLHDFERIEDISGAMLPMWWAFILYALIQHNIKMALNESEQRYRLLFEKATDGIFLMDEGVCIDCNPKSLEIYGCSKKDELIGHTPMAFSPKSQPDGELSEEKSDRYLKACFEGVPQRFYWQNIRKDGTLIDVSVSLNILELSGEIYLQAMVHDITERIKMERERGAMLKQLASKNEELESILSASSHDLKSPIVNLRGFSGELNNACSEFLSLFDKTSLSNQERNRLFNLIQKDIPESLHFIDKSSERLESLLDGMLRVSRISRENIKIEVLNAKTIIDGICSSMRYQIEKSGAKLRVKNIPDCKCDKLVFEQVFTNLITNALKYLNPERKGEIYIDGKVEDDRSVYFVEDNGIGISKSHQDKIFEMFHRLNPMDGLEGEGIGLTIVKRVLDLVDGKIWLESEVGKGSKFYVSLPVKIIC